MFVTRLLEAPWNSLGIHRWPDMTSNNSQVDCGTGTMLSWYRRVQSLHHQQSEPGRMDPHCPVVHAVAWPYPLNVATEINQWNLYFEPFCVLIHNKKIIVDTNLGSTKWFFFLKSTIFQLFFAPLLFEKLIHIIHSSHHTGINNHSMSKVTYIPFLPHSDA